MKAMILAAGLGTRMRPLTDHMPKPLLEVGGKPLIVWHLENLRAAGFDEVVINTAWLGDKLEAVLGEGNQFGLRIKYSREDQPLETAGGIYRALPLLGDDPFLVVNGDIWTDFDFSSLQLAAADVAQLVLVNNPPHNPNGDFDLAGDGKVHDAVSSGTGDARLTFAGIGIYQPSLFVHLDDGELKLAPLLRERMAVNEVSGVHHPGQWWDIGTPERLQQLDRFLRSP